MKSPYLHYYRPSKAPDSVWRATWALRLDSCPAERLTLDSEESVLLRRLREGMELVRALTAQRGAADEVALALRFIVWPDADNFAAGRIEVALLGQIGAPDKATAGAWSAELLAETRALLGGALPDHAWSAAQSKAEFDALWRPLKAEHVAELRRRESTLDLPPQVSRPSLGHRSQNEATDAPVTMVHPWVPHPARLSGLLRALLLGGQPLVWQVSIAPTRLHDAEAAALRAQIARCERAENAQSNENSDFSPLAQCPTMLAQRAATSLAQTLARLESAPLLLNVAVWGESPVAPALVEAVGALCSAAEEAARPGGNSSWAGGGFEARLPRDANERKLAKSNVARLEFSPWGATTLPLALKRWTRLAHVEEAAAALRFPCADSGGLPGLTVRASRQRPLPRELAARANAGESYSWPLGVNRYGGGQQIVALSPANRRQHVYLAGQTGTGKSTLLKSLALGDMKAGLGVAVVDPHGDLFAELLELVPAHRRDDVVILDPTDMNNPVGLNLLECRDETERYFLVREMRSMMERLINDQFEGHSASMTGPIFYQHMQMNLLLAMSDMDDPGTLLEFYEIFQRKSYWKRWTPLKWSDGRLRSWVENGLPNSNYRQVGDQGIAFGDYISSKFEDFLFDPRLRLIFGQKRSTVDLRAIMDEGKILLVNLAKGQVSEANARFLGMVLMAKLQAAALSRIELPVSGRRPFSVFADEFQSLATQNFSLLLSEARKFGISLTLANQFVSQIKDPRIVQSIFGNVGTLVSFRVGRADAELLAPLYGPQFDADDLVNLPNWNACVKTTADGQIAAPFSLQTLLPTGAPDTEMARELKAASAQTYGRARADVEAAIERGYADKRPAPEPSKNEPSKDEPELSTEEQSAREQQAREKRAAQIEADRQTRERERQKTKTAVAASLFGSVENADPRHHPVPKGQEFVLDNPNLPDDERTLRTLDNFSDAINLIDPDVFKRHVNAERNEFADWIETVFLLPDLAEMLRRYPTPLRMMVSIEKFLRQ